MKVNASNAHVLKIDAVKNKQFGAKYMIKTDYQPLSKVQYKRKFIFSIPKSLPLAILSSLLIGKVVLKKLQMTGNNVIFSYLFSSTHHPQ